jgi:hypothetical protein
LNSLHHTLSFVVLDQIRRTLRVSPYLTWLVGRYQLTAPLLMENEAISRYIYRTGNLNLRRTMPELTTVGEAVYLATQEYMLDSDQQEALTKLLVRLWPHG